MKVTRRWLERLLLLASLPSLHGQSTIHLPSQGRQADFSGYPQTKPARVVGSLPVSCASGEVAAVPGGAGAGLYFCTAAGIWTPVAAHTHALTDLSGITGKQGGGSIVQTFGGGATAAGECAKFDASGNIISAGAPCGGSSQSNYSQAFTAQSSVTLNHGLSTANVIVSCYDSGNREVEPDSVTVLDADNAAITFATPQTGRCVVNGTGGGGGAADTTAPVNSGTGAAILKAGTNVTAKTLKAGTNVTITGGTDEITISAAGGTAGITSINSQTGLSQALSAGAFVNIASAANIHTISVTNTQGNGSRLATVNAGPADGCASWSGGTLTSMGAPCGSGGGGGTAGVGIVISGTTISADPATVPSYLSGAASLTFNSFSGSGNCEEQNIALSGAAVGDAVSVGMPAVFPVGIINGAAWVSSANTVTIRLCRLAGANTISSQPFRAWVNKIF